MHRTAVEIFRWHPDSGNGVCIRCGDRSPCYARYHAAEVIVAAGEDPRRYDTAQSPPGVQGLPMGGRAQRVDAPGLLYQRDLD